MSDPTLVRMADILLPLPPQDTAAGLGWIAGALLLGLATVAWWWHRRHPLRRLARSLAAGRLPPRAAAHRLARLLPAGMMLREELDRLRFQRHTPESSTVAELIRRAVDGR